MIRRWACVLGLVLALAGAARAGFGYSGGGRPGGGGRPQRLPTIALQWAPDLLQANLPASGAAVASARPALGGITPPVDPWDLPDDIDPLRPKPRPLRPGRGPGGLERGWSRFPRQHVDLSFRALNDVETYVASNKTNDPPSPCLCVGAGFVIEAVSSAVRVYSARTGAPLRAAVPLDVFMGQPDTKVNNPRCFYDAPSGRWFLTATSQDGRNAPRRVALSVSAGSDPTRGWRRYLLNTPTTLEQPSFNSVALGVYPEALVIAGNLANGSRWSSFQGAFVHAIPKAPLLSGALADVPGFYCNASALPYPSTSGKLFQYLMPAQQQAPYVHRVGAPIPLLATAPDRDADNATVRLPVFMLRLPRGRNPLASPFSEVTLSVQLALLPPRGAYRTPPDAAQPSTLVPPLGYTTYGTSQPSLISSSNGRMSDVTAQGSRLYATWGSAASWGGAEYAAISWAVLDVDRWGVAHVADAGLVRLRGGHLLLPSIAVASNGRFAAIAATASDASLVFPSSAYLPLTIASSGRTSVGSVVMLARGAGPYDAESGYKDSWSHSGDSSSDDKVANWGRTSAVVVDPANPCNMWAMSEYVSQYCTPEQFSATTGTLRCGATRTDETNWATQISRICAPGCRRWH